MKLDEITRRGALGAILGAPLGAAAQDANTILINSTQQLYNNLRNMSWGEESNMIVQRWMTQNSANNLPPIVQCIALLTKLFKMYADTAGNPLYKGVGEYRIYHTAQFMSKRIYSTFVEQGSMQKFVALLSKPDTRTPFTFLPNDNPRPWPPEMWMKNNQKAVAEVRARLNKR